MGIIKYSRYYCSKMVTKTEKCSYTEARSLFHQKIKPVKLTWTLAWRAYNKKIKVDDIQKKRSRKTTRIQKAVVGMSIEEIRRKKAESREDRDKANVAAEQTIKDRKAKAMQAKKAEKSKAQKNVGKAADKAIKKVAGGKGGKR